MLYFRTERGRLLWSSVPRSQSEWHQTIAYQESDRTFWRFNAFGSRWNRISITWEKEPPEDQGEER